MKRFLPLALLTSLFVGCVQDQISDIPVVLDSHQLYATIDLPENRVQLDKNQHTTWTEKDQIVVLSNSEYAVYEFDGKTGDREGSFTKIADGGAISSDYLFKNKSYALYPYETYYGYGGFSDGTPAIFAEIPSVQPYMKDSYGLHTNLMLGESDDAVNYKFKNLLGYLCLSLTGDKCVKSIELTNNDGSSIAGVLYYDITNINTAWWYGNESSLITLDCGEGVQLSATPTKFYFTLAPITLSRGFTITVQFTDGSNFFKTTSKEIAISRNTISPMKPISTITDESEYQKIYIHHSGPTMFMPYIGGGENAEAVGQILWGDGTSSLLFSSIEEFHDYKDSQESHIVTIDAQNATSITIRSCMGVSQIDVSNF